MRMVLAKYQQHINYPNHGDQTLDHCYSQLGNSYKPLSHPPFGKADHISILLLPTYKRLKQENGPRFCCFSHYPKLVTIGQGWNIDGPVNRELRLPTQLPLHHNGPVQRLHYCRRCTNPSVHLLLYFTLTRSAAYAKIETKKTIINQKTTN